MLIEICLPAYNEESILEKNITILLNFVKKQNWFFNIQITVVLNNCSDNSLEIIRELSNKHSEVVYYNLKKEGKGNAVKHAWEKSQADIFAYMDVDIAVSLENLDSLLSSIYSEKNHLVWGSRLLPLSKTKRGVIRTISSKLYNLLSQAVLHHKFTDLQCGFKAIDNKIREDILPLIEDDNWFFDTELIIYSKGKKYRLKEIPVKWEESRYQKRSSKIKPLKDAYIFIKKTYTLAKKIKSPNK
jgi:glycosyltransferase involved in cell wall biosynthesis